MKDLKLECDTLVDRATDGGKAWPDDLPHYAITIIERMEERAEQAECERDEAREKLVLLTEWTHVHGAALRPVAAADTFGDGMRAAKEQVADLIRERREKR